MRALKPMCMVVAIAALLMSPGCLHDSDGDVDPVKLQNNARLAGEAAVIAYFTIQPDHQDKARELLPVVSEIRKIATAIPEDGFTALKPKVDEALERELTGDEARYLIPAKRLAEIILEELDKKAERDGWKEKLDSTAAVISAFLEGSESALMQYAPPT